MTDDLAKAARAAMLLWEMNPQRQALARMLNIPPGRVTDDMIRRVCSTLNLRSPPIQQIPRTKKP